MRYLVLFSTLFGPSPNVRRPLPLAQILFHPIGLAQQEGDVLLGRFDEAVRGQQRLLELFGEFLLFLVAPTCSPAR